MTTPELREENRAYLLPPWQWRPLMRRVEGIPKPLRYVLSVAADYAGQLGTEVKPGIALLSVESESSYEQVKDALRLARNLGLLFLAQRGNRRKGLADEYWLIASPDLLERAKVESPEARKLRAEKVRIAHRRDGSKSPSVTADPVEDTALQGLVDPVDTTTTGSVGPRSEESIRGLVDPVKPGIQGPVDPLNDRLRGLVDPPTSPTKSDLPGKPTTPPDDLVVSGPVTLRAHEAAQKPESISSSMPAEGGGPYDKAALAARLAAARQKHDARGNARTGRTPYDPGTTGLDRLRAAVDALTTPPATPA